MKLQTLSVFMALLTTDVMQVTARTHHYAVPDHGFFGNGGDQKPFHNDHDPLPLSTREHWMRVALSALFELSGSPCPHNPFGTSIVNHTGRASHDLGQLICVGANQFAETGNPTLHGEIAAIKNCTDVLSAPPYNLSPSEIALTWKDLSLYTTGEPCTMCTSAINWGQFSEYIYATDVRRMLDLGWDQIPVTSRELLRRSSHYHQIRAVGPILEAETDPLYRWQYQEGECPRGCVKSEDENVRCVVEK